MSFQPIFPDLPGLSPVEQQSGAFTYERYDASQSIDELGSRNVVSAQLTAGQPTISHLRSFPHQHPISAPHGTTPLHDETVPAETSMGPPPKRRKRKAPTLRAKDWEPYKARVLELHITKKLPLKEVKTIIEEEFGFNAELRQYRTRLTQWGKDKNVKPAEMAAIVRKRQQRRFDNGDKGEQAFTVRGITVESHKIDRWMARNGVSQTSLYATSPAASTPSAVSCHTISKHGSVISSPTNSTRSLNFSPGNTTSMIMSPAAASAATPTFSVREMSETHSIASTESIPVPTYQPLPTLPSMFQSTASDPVDHDQVPRRFRQDAEERVRKKLLEAEESLGPSHRHALNLRIELGSILRSQGRYKFAGETDRRAIEDCRNEDSNTTSMFDAMDFLVGVLRNRRAYDEAHVLQKRVFESKVTMGEEHSSTIDSMINLVYSYGYIDKVEGAEALCVGALEVSKRLGEKHDDALYVMCALADICIDHRRLYGAERLSEEILQLGKEALEVAPEVKLENMAQMAYIYRLQERFKEAEELEVQTVETLVALDGKGHLSTLGYQEKLAVAYKLQGQLKEAEDLGSQVWWARKRVLGERHPTTLNSMAFLVRIYMAQGQLQEAEDLGAQALEAMTRVLGEMHPETLDLTMSLIRIYVAQGRSKEAEDLGTQMSGTMKEVLGEQHPKTLEAENLLIKIYAL